jgi:metal-responsive CopG/Arc/MetJ family transcriptional regulator
MNSRSKKTTRISVSLDESDYQNLNQLAQTGDVSVAWLVRRALTDFLAKHRGSTIGQLPLNLEDRKMAP